MDWTRLVMWVLLCLPSHGEEINTTVTGNNSDVTEVPMENTIRIKNNKNIDLNLSDENTLGLCLGNIDDSTSEFLNMCYLIMKEVNEDYWTLGDMTKYYSTLSCSEESILREMNSVVGALGGITLMMAVILVAMLISYLLSCNFTNKIFGNLEANGCGADAKDEQDNRTPTIPRRPSHIEPKEEYSRHKEDDNEPEDYIRPDPIQIWRVAEMEKESALNGNVKL